MRYGKRFPRLLLLVMATESNFYTRWGEGGRIDELKTVLNINPQDYYEIKNCNHMLHLEKPEETANAIIDFFSR